MVVTTEGLDCPEFICERCGKKILIGSGHVYWRGAANGHRANVFCYHDGCAHRVVLAEAKKGTVSRMPIKDFIGFLCHNSHSGHETNAG